MDHTAARLLALSADRTLLAEVSGDSTVRLVDTESGDLRATLTGHEKRVGSVSFNPQGSRVATVSDDGTVRLWDTASGELLSTLGGNLGAVLSVAFDPDGSRVASGSDNGTVRLWDTGCVFEGQDGVALANEFRRTDCGAGGPTRLGCSNAF